MNRIILIGNGFDLAHGMKTSYKDFITNFWKTKGKEVVDNDKPHDCDFININKKVDGNPNDLECFEDFLTLNERCDVKVRFKNDLIKELSSNSHLKSFWVDIENEYYSRLKSISHKERNDDAKSELEKLHKEFDQIKNELTKYLKQQQVKFNADETNESKQIKDAIRSKFKYRDLDHKTLKTMANNIYSSVKKDKEALDNDIVDDYELNEDSRIIRQNINPSTLTKSNVFRLIADMGNDEAKAELTSFYPKDILLLNFNYTNTHKIYQTNEKHALSGSQNILDIKIHGSINNPETNPIIFGFGDELDKDYQAIEDLDDNDYLENIKSIKYLETDNYRKLLEFAESDKFQICIFGHSCGNSDRTLLNTLFEHDNCVSIKPYYYINDNGEDNYSQITRNISRNFKSKAKMRERVVNKTYTETLT